MGLHKRAHELWLDGDDNPYETLTAQLEAEKAARDAQRREDEAEAQAAIDAEYESRVLQSWQSCENDSCDVVGNLQQVTMYLTEIAPVSEFQAGKWTCESCGYENYWANS